MNKYKNSRKNVTAKSKKHKEMMLWENILLVSLIIVFVLIVFLICCFAYSRGYKEGRVTGYMNGCTVGYEAKSQVEYDSRYWAGFMEGCKQTTEAGFGVKNKLIDAYYSLLVSGKLKEAERISFTYRFRELLKVPVPNEDDAEQFLADIEEILSSNT